MRKSFTIHIKTPLFPQSMPFYNSRTYHRCRIEKEIIEAPYELPVTAGQINE
ncbi:hypothetical protein [Odoribacter laneus]|uniref:hypothetical protein n=1 Tax=Odoribacter laneus TaxID=626933 RepID=UPI0023F509E0|nr:hypothetical protein [Odoribacter laneus]